MSPVAQQTVGTFEEGEESLLRDRSVGRRLALLAFRRLFGAFERLGLAVRLHRASSDRFLSSLGSTGRIAFETRILVLCSKNSTEQTCTGGLLIHCPSLGVLR